MATASTTMISMGQTERLDFEFVEFIPDELEDRRLYISTEYATAAHRCACGCGVEVVTPLSPTDWSLTFDGETVSLNPSIGNWEFDCQSHYWVRRGRIVWAPRWSRERIEAGRVADREVKRKHFDEPTLAPSNITEHPEPAGLWSRMWRRIRSWWLNSA